MVEQDQVNMAPGGLPRTCSMEVGQGPDIAVIAYGFRRRAGDSPVH